MERLARRDAGNALTVLDVGAYESPYLLRLDWIPTKVATDIQARPQVWEHMNGVAFIQGDFLQLKFGTEFDLVICNQVLEHLPDDIVVSFVTKLASLAKVLIVTTTYNMPTGMIAGHIQDPISEEKFRSWFQNTTEMGAITEYYHPPDPKKMAQMWQLAVWKKSRMARR
jgi:SAM-dependent methyltransferase